MKEIFKIFLKIAPVILCASLAQAGVSTSGGGYAVVCRNNSAQVESVELLDLFEARRIHKLTLIQSKGVLIDDVREGTRNTYLLQLESDKALTTNELSFRRGFKNFLDSIVWVQDAKRFPKINDLGDIRKVLPLLGPKCQIEQLAWMDDRSRKIYVVRSLWDRMNTLNQAALNKHELLYMGSRSYVLYPETTSEAIRLQVGLIFAANKIPSAINGVPKGLNWKRIGHQNTIDGTVYYAFLAGKNQAGIPVTRIQFLEVAGRPILTKTYVDIPQRVTSGSRFPVTSFQLRGWSMIAINGQGRDGSGLLLQLLNEKGLPVLNFYGL